VINHVINHVILLAMQLQPNGAYTSHHCCCNPENIFEKKMCISLYNSDKKVGLLLFGGAKIDFSIRAEGVEP